MTQKPTIIKYYTRNDKLRYFNCGERSDEAISGYAIMSVMQKLIDGAKKLGLKLTPGQVEQFNIYYRELTDWNKRINLTAITGYEDVQVKHFLDALTVTLAWPRQLENKLNLIDVGTGAGVPGIPLKIVFSHLNLTVLDSIAKKATFLRHLTQRLGLSDVEILVGRAEEMAHRQEYREKFDIVISRAVAQLPVLAELTIPFCAIGGTIITQKKGDIEAEVKQANRAINETGGQLLEIKRVNLEGLEDKRWLVVINKKSHTPLKYPRRPGIPAKRPLI